MSEAFEFRTEARAPLVRAAVRHSVKRRSSGVLFLTGRLAAQAHLIADDLAAHDLDTAWLIVSAVGVLSTHGEIEGQSGGVGLRFPVRASTVMSRDGDLEFGAAIVDELEASAGATACVFLRGDDKKDAWLSHVRGARRFLQSKVFGGGSLPGEPILSVTKGRVEAGGAAGLVFPGRTFSQISTSSACRLLSPLGEVTQRRGPAIQAIDHLSALERLEQSTVGLETGSLVLLAVAGGERPLDPAGRALALRPILGVDPSRGSILLDEELPDGARVAFAVRDPHGARTDLDAHLRSLRTKSAGTAPGFGLYVSCAGRGRSLYNSPDVDSRLIGSQFPKMPFVGLQSTFEVAPLDGALTPQVYAGVLGVFSLPS